MGSAFLDQMAALIDARGVTVHRFEFSYMAERSVGVTRRPAPRAESLVEEYLAAMDEVRTIIGGRARLFAGGKSMGGRIACLAAQRAPSLAGVVVLGFPLAPPRKAGVTRAGVLETLSRPALIVQGTRDPFGGRAAFSAVSMPAAADVIWIEDGDHDLKPRKVSGLTHDKALQAAAEAIAGFCRRDD